MHGNTNDLLILLSKWEYSIITVVIDKKAQYETYKFRYDPYHYALEILLERYIFILEENNAVGDVMAESRGGREDIRLKKTYTDLYLNGTHYVDSSRIGSKLTTKQLKVKNKTHNIAGLQLADLIAHPSRNEILSESGLINKKEKVFGDRIIQTISKKYYMKNGIISGYGKKMLP